MTASRRIISSSSWTFEGTHAKGTKVTKINKELKSFLPYLGDLCVQSNAGSPNQTPKIGKHALRESEGFRQFNLLLKRITDSSQALHCFSVYPAFQAGRKNCCDHRIICPVQQAFRVIPQAFE